MTKRLTLFFIFAAIAAVIFEQFGYGIVHSVFLGLMMVLLAPGVILIFFAGDAYSALFWLLFVSINVLYYEGLYSVLRKR